MATAKSLTRFVPTTGQAEAIAYRKGNLQITACAGSGKTEAISRRICSLIEDGVEPNQVIAFTFTERAAASLQARIKKRIGESKGPGFLDRLGPMFVGTIHSFCLQMLQTHVPRYGNFDILDENRLAGLLSREHKRIGIDKLGEKHWKPISEFLRNVDVVENELIDPARLKGTAVGEVFRAFSGMLERYRYLTFGLLISTAVRSLEDHLVFERVHSPLRHLIVDEYQDINPAQERLIELLATPPVHLCVVGDDDQSIYQWRGSDVSNILDFKKRYKAKLVSLSVNRRSRPKIIEAANKFAKTITPRLPKKMNSHRAGGGPEICCWSAEVAEDEAERIANTIERLVKIGYRYRDVAILYRSVRTSAPPLIEALQKRGIPVRCAGRTGLFMQPEPTVMGKLYAWLTGNEWKTERFAESESVELDDLIAEFEHVFNNGKSIKGLLEFLSDLKNSASAGDKPVSLIRDYYRLLNLLGVHKYDLANPITIARMGALASFSQILADFEHVTRRARWVEEDGSRVFRGGQDRGEWYYKRLFNYLQYYALDAYEGFGGEETFDLDVVDILTIHQAKGLEWPVVFVPSLVQGRFPSSYTGRKQEWILNEKAFPTSKRKRYDGSETDERRLFYVAMTRAKDMLYLSRFRKIKNRKQPSPFLVEVAGGDPLEIAKLPMPPPFVPSSDEQQDLPSLSFSDLADYDDCPMRYRLSGSFGFQPPLATELGYGKTIHHILRRLADFVKDSGKIPTKKQIEALMGNEFYMPFANHAAFEQLSARAKDLIDRYMTVYKADLLRVWEVERPFSLHLENGVVTGRADVILDYENGVPSNLALVDYKTATGKEVDDVFAFQLAIYAAAGRGEGLKVEAAYLHRLKEGDRTPVPVDDSITKAARDRANVLIEGLVAGAFPAKPHKKKCGSCDVRAVCGSSLCGKRDL